MRGGEAAVKSVRGRGGGWVNWWEEEKKERKERKVRKKIIKK